MHAGLRGASDKLTCTESSTGMAVPIHAKLLNVSEALTWQKSNTGKADLKHVRLFDSKRSPGWTGSDADNDKSQQANPNVENNKSDLVEDLEGGDVPRYKEFSIEVDDSEYANDLDGRNKPICTKSDTNDADSG